VLGGSTRVPAVFNLVQEVFGMTPSRTLNAKEVVSRGAALQCAMISPLIKVGRCEGRCSVQYAVVCAAAYAQFGAGCQSGMLAMHQQLSMYSVFSGSRVRSMQFVDAISCMCADLCDCCRAPLLPAGA
jgi:hypothetical protein